MAGASSTANYAIPILTSSTIPNLCSWVRICDPAYFPLLFHPSWRARLLRLAVKRRGRPHSLKAVEWFGKHEYAVLGSELWLLKDGTIQSLPTGLSAIRELHGKPLSRQSGEAWSSFVARAAVETRTYLQSFNPSGITEDGRVYFNLVWVNEEDYTGLSS